MTIPVALNGIESIVSSIGIPQTILNNDAMQVNPAQQASPDRIDFKELLNTAIKSVSDSQISADDAMTQLAAGQNIELHNVMLAAQKAELTLQLALQVKNKITDAYSEIMRMSI
jgi:flagellar hook-basal body complex protein FliE